VNAGRGDSTRALADAVRRARGACLTFVEAALNPVNDDWLEALLEYAQQPEIGAAGGKVGYADGRIRHAGLLLGVGNGVARAMHGESAETYGYFSAAIGIRNYSAVSGECLMTRRDVFDRLGGFDLAMPWRGADVDYCLKAIHAGLRVVFTPYAELRSIPESGLDTDVDAAALAALAARWPTSFDRDPYYNPNLSREMPYRLGDMDSGR
jgi:GT2 family glycosyltransferase